MRLINVKSFKLKEFHGDKIPPYAILSHRWEEEEVSFRDWKKSGRERKLGFRKIELACEQAIIDGHDWLWVDTCCIDKTSSAELSEAINSMFAWYANSERCYAFLSDVPSAHDKLNILRQFRESRWFTRGWTLQELVAPKNVIFYADDWSKIGSRGRSMTKDITKATGIDEGYLIGKVSIQTASVAKKMSWISRRETTRPEDLAYCMLGIFDINMPLLYGEGRKAFMRLQEEIIKVSDDQTIFCWDWGETVPSSWTSILAPSPEVFRHCGDVVPKRVDVYSRDISPYQMTNAGLSMRLPTRFTMGGYIIAINATLNKNGMHFSPVVGWRAWIPVIGEDRNGTLHVERVSYPVTPLILDDRHMMLRQTQRTIIVKRKEDEGASDPASISRYPSSMRVDRSAFRRLYSPSFSPPLHRRFGVYPTFVTSDLRDTWSRPHRMRIEDFGKNIMWLDSRYSTSTGLVLSLDSPISDVFGLKGMPGDDWEASRATVWIGARIKIVGEFLVDCGWSCRILSTNDRERVTAMPKQLIDGDGHKDQFAHKELDLKVRLGTYIHGLGEGRIRFLELDNKLDQEDANTESVLSGSDVAVAFGKYSMR